MSRPPAPDGDTGLAVERTRLSWRRTRLAVTVIAVLAVRLALSRGAVGAVVVALTALGWLAVLVLTHPRYAGASGTRATGPGHVLPLTALVSAGFAGLGLLLVLAPVR
ncbi:DUF202 domain-containing protein [Plantactinospora sp. CA-290183]|uniref:DUF202 domain-containing protein n=1 Tax=Plantactinospora sp. CA-290183 TaxID=3240006 RepID=UPI003D91F9D8